jgi:uncharacterized protein YabE (DUF348 family)
MREIKMKYYVTKSSNETNNEITFTTGFDYEDIEELMIEIRVLIEDGYNVTVRKADSND